MTVEVCLLRAGTTSAALLDIVVFEFGMVNVYQWEGSSVFVSEGNMSCTDDVGGGGLFSVTKVQMTKHWNITCSRGQIYRDRCT